MAGSHIMEEPQTQRRLSLAGLWQFQLDPDGSATVETLLPDREITVPMPWQVAHPELQSYSGYAWYRRLVEIEESWLQGELLLHFGAVDYWCQVYVNGLLAGGHEGGYMPFTVCVRELAQAGRNEIAVRVYDVAQSSIVIPRWPNPAPDPGVSRPPFNPNDIPHGKQEWYINVGGIWQDVTLIAVPATYISHLQVTPDIHTGRAHLRVEIAGNVSQPAASELHLSLQGSETLPGITLSIESEKRVYEADLTVTNPRLWDLDDPYLYTAHAGLRGPEGLVGDEKQARFGYREIKSEGGQLVLNGHPIFLLSALDQDIYADTIYTVPSEEYLRDQFRKSKELGLNCLRCHIKPPDPLYLDLADEMGLLVWTEIPSWRTFYLKGTMHENQLNLYSTVKQRAERLLEEMIRRDSNHPSIVIWTLVNEDWGTTLPMSAADRAWVAQLYDRCKQLDPTRLVVDNSACPHPWGPNVHVRSDLDDFHVYTNIPDQAFGWENTIEQFGNRPLWTYSSHGDAQRTGSEPLILSEFGNWGMPLLKNLRNGKGEDPGWFDLGPWWSSWEGEAGWARGVEERFKRLGLEAVWGSYDQFAHATQWHQYAAMKFEIEAMRRQPGISGYVITELADIYWESNGLLDFYRNPKAYHALFSRINAPDVVVPRLATYAQWDDRPVQTRLVVSHFGKGIWRGANLRWSVEGGENGTVDIPDLRPGSVATLGKEQLSLPSVTETRRVPVNFVVEGAGGEQIASNTLELLLFPADGRKAEFRDLVTVLTLDNPERHRSVEVFARPPEGIDCVQPDTRGWEGIEEDASEDSEDYQPHGLEHSMRHLGYVTSRRIAPSTRLIVATFPDAASLQWVRNGGDMLLLSSGPSPFFWVQGRNGPYSGSWLTSFSWLKLDVHKRLRAASNPLGMAFQPVMPTRTILGLPVEDKQYHADFLSGMTSGWVGHPAVHTVQFRYGRGRVIMTTYSLEHALPHSPVAVSILHDLIDHLTSDECRPTLAANW